MVSKEVLQEELNELEGLLNQVKSPGLLDYLKVREKALRVQLCDDDKNSKTKSIKEETVEHVDATSSIKKVEAGTSKRWTPISTFAFDQNSTNVQLYVTLENVGSLDPENVTCKFTKDSLDLRVVGLDGKDLRLFKSGLEHDIDPDNSKIKIKANSVVVSLKKVKGKYGPEHWNNLTGKRKKPDTNSDDPMGGVMDLLKDMYNDGDEKMKATIGEAMLKSRQGDPIA